MKTTAEIIDQLCPVFIAGTGARIGPDTFKKLIDRLGEIMGEGLDTFLMTDQPPTCPHCGKRVHIIHGAEGNKQICECPGCHFRYNLEEDEDEP